MRSNYGAGQDIKYFSTLVKALKAEFGETVKVHNGHSWEEHDPSKLKAEVVASDESYVVIGTKERYARLFIALNSSYENPLEWLYDYSASNDADLDVIDKIYNEIVEKIEAGK